MSNLIMPNLKMKRWHIACARGHIFDASLHRSSNKTWHYYMNLAREEIKKARRSN